MKLRELALAGTLSTGTWRVNDLHEGLNVLSVEGAHAAQRIRQAIRSHALDAANVPQPRTVSNRLFPILDAELFDAFFVVDSSVDPLAAQHTGRILRERIAAMIGCGEWESEAAYLEWQRQAAERRERYAALSKERSQLESQLAQVSAAFEKVTREQTEWTMAWERNVGAWDDQAARLRKAEAETERRIDELNRLIAQEMAAMDRAERQVRYEPIKHPLGDRLGVWYDYLDDLHQERRRWRASRDYVQQQRLRLRDEMARWKGRPLSAPEHPYHVAEQHLQSIANRLQELDQLLNGLNADSARQIVHAARKDVAQLCDELSRQFRHLRYRAAAVELRQLRQLHQKMAEYDAQLAERCDQLVEMIRQIDPAGAEAIASASADFIHYATEHGFLSARRHFLGPEPSLGEVQYRLVRPDVAPHEHNLSVWRNQLAELTARLRSLQAELSQLHGERDAWLREHPRPTEVEVAALRDHKSRLRDRLAAVQTECDALAAKMGDDLRRVPWQGDVTLSRAAQFLQRLSGESVQSLRPSSTGFVWDAIDWHGCAREWHELSPEMRWRILCCVRLAACVSLEKLGVRGPFVVDQALDHLTDQELPAWSDLLREVAASGLQVLILTEQRRVSDYFRRWVAGGQGRVIDVRLLDESIAPFKPTVYPLSDDHRAHDEPGFPVDSWRSPYKPVVYVDETRAPFSLVAVQSENGMDLPYEATDDLASGKIQYDRQTPLARVDLVDSIQLKHFRAIGIDTLGQFLDLNAAQLPSTLLHHGILPGQIDRWQAQGKLLLDVAGLLPRDARLLVGCGIAKTADLLAAPPKEIVERIHRYLASPDGQRWGVDESRYTEARIARWQRAARTRVNVTEPHYSREYHRQRARAEATHSAPGERYTRGAYFSRRKPRDLRPGHYYQFEGNEIRPRRLAETRSTAERGSELPAQDRPYAETPPISATDGGKFYLNLHDPIEAAPSIGPKTAERFTAIGIHTIADFLRHSADSMAEKINYKRLSADVIRQWQQQTRLVLQVPNLRGHDAQLLVACGVTEVEQLASASPRQLYDRIAPFADTKEGIRIIRAGKKPDLAEISDWIRWAQNSRSLQAA